jgi:mannan endo-1,4-beta-mannosidase
MSLVGKKLLNSVFEQDPNHDWIKINNVAVGESKMYSYNEYNSKDIGGLLNRLKGDNNITCVVYNWNTGVAYAKTGFNLSNSGDYKTASGYTTFILKSKISQFYKTPTPSKPPSKPPSKTAKEFVSWNATTGSFMCNGVKFVPVGFNAYWLGYTEAYDYPMQDQVIEIFTVAQKMAATVVRCHTMGISSGSEKSLRPRDNTLNNNAWKAIDFAFYTAKQKGIRIIAPLVDCYSWYNGSYKHFTDTRGINKNDFWTNMDVRNDFKKFINDWLNHTNSYTGIKIKDDPTLFMIETGNEFNIRPDAGSTTFPTEEWTRDIINYIKSIDSNHLIMDGTDEPLGKANNFSISTVDCFTGHFYWNEVERLDYGANNAKRVGKAYIVGEVDSGFGVDWFRQLESRPNVTGSLFWHLYPHQYGLAGGQKINHTDGFTLWFPEDKNKLILWSNHFRRMRKLPEISQL